MFFYIHVELRFHVFLDSWHLRKYLSHLFGVQELFPAILIPRLLSNITDFNDFFFMLGDEFFHGEQNPSPTPNPYPSENPNHKKNEVKGEQNF